MNNVTSAILREGRPDEHVTTTIGRPVTIDMPFPHAGQNILEVELDTEPRSIGRDGQCVRARELGRIDVVNETSQTIGAAAERPLIETHENGSAVDFLAGLESDIEIGNSTP